MILFIFVVFLFFFIFIFKISPFHSHIHIHVTNTFGPESRIGLARGRKGRYGAVSYTHLDVYKRQLIKSSDCKLDTIG